MTKLENLMSRIEAKEKALDELKKDIAQLNKQARYIREKDEAKKAVKMMEFAKDVTFRGSDGKPISLYEVLEEEYNKEQTEKRAALERKRAEAEQGS